MKKTVAMKAALCLIVACGLLANCTSYMEFRRMDLAADNASGKILNLRFAGDPSGDYTEQAEKLVKSGFLDTRSEEYGYYDIRFEALTKEYSPAVVALYYVPAFLITLPLLGAPTAGEEFTITAHFMIFDSKGGIVKHYKKTDSFDKWVGLYYGNATGKGAEEFSRLFAEIFEAAAADSEQINKTLKDSGPLAGQGVDKDARSKIDGWFKNG
ncbi:MAG: hypothetical protein LBT33_09035 [Spirochaetia bacterium]|jgi:hypothetical protein|nr:hypothetical protein [Spirochaetia bacterium]